MPLRPYQQDMYNRVRQAFRAGNRRVFMSLVCGGGKTQIFSHMAKESRRRGKRVWICLPRRELLEQSSKTLDALEVPHGRIDASHQESDHQLHLVSKDTLLRRYDKIKNDPDFVILDEAHLYYDQQKRMQEEYPKAFMVGCSASPERLDGRGLADLYDEHVEGPDVYWMVKNGFLAPVRIYCPPVVGLEEVKRSGTEYDEEQLHEFLERNKTYGSAVEHYEKFAEGRTALVFCRSVKSAETAAERFREQGWKFESVSAETPLERRQSIIEGLREGTIDGVTNCEIATYGLDVPRICCVICLRPTLSRALVTQMWGRGLRTHPSKTECVILDHVGLVVEHGHPYAAPHWNFEGNKKRRKLPRDISLRLCPETWLYCTKPSCLGCENNTTGRKSRAEHVVNCQLREVAKPVRLRDRAREERAEYRNRMSAAYQEAARRLERGDYSGVKELLRLHKQAGTKNHAIVVYHMLSHHTASSPDMRLLEEIEICSGFQKGWRFVMAKQMEKKRRVG